MLNIVKFANSVYNKYVFDISSGVNRFDFYKTKFCNDQMKTIQLCSILYKKLY